LKPIAKEAFISGFTNEGLPIGVLAPTLSKESAKEEKAVPANITIVKDSKRSEDIDTRFCIHIY